MFAEKKSNGVSVKSNLKHNDDFMADGLNTLSSGAVLKGSVSNVAVFLCRADEKLLFLSWGAEPIPETSAKKANPFTLLGEKSFSVRNTQMKTKIHRHFVSLNQKHGKHTLTHSLVIVLSRGDQVNEGSGGDHKKQRHSFLWMSLIALTAADLWHPLQWVINRLSHLDGLDYMINCDGHRILFTRVTEI